MGDDDRFFNDTTRSLKEKKILGNESENMETTGVCVMDFNFQFHFMGVTFFLLIDKEFRYFRTYCINFFFVHCEYIVLNQPSSSLSIGKIFFFTSSTLSKI